MAADVGQTAADVRRMSKKGENTNYYGPTLGGQTIVCVRDSWIRIQVGGTGVHTGASGRRQKNRKMGSDMNAGLFAQTRDRGRGHQKCA